MRLSTLIVAAAIAAGASGILPVARRGAMAATQEAAAPETRLLELEALVARLQEEIAALKAAGSAEMRLAELEKRIEALSREIERLRIGAAAAPEAGEPVAGFGPAASKVYRAKPGVSIGGYGEMLYQNFEPRADDGTPTGEEDTIDFLRAVLYFGYKFDDRFLFNSEIEFEHAFVEGGEESGEAAVEFAYVDFRAAKGFGLRGGLLLIPMGFLNELHEPPIFFGARRPEVERVLLPTTWRENGVGVYGQAGPLAYRAYVVASLDASGFGAGSGFRGGRQSGSESLAHDMALTARLDWMPVPGLQLGGSAYSGDTTQGSAGLEGGRLTVWDAHLQWTWRGLHVRGLYARSALDEAAAINAANGLAGDDGVGSRMRGYYGEIGWNVLSLREGTDQELSPFVRYESFDTQADVPAGFTADPANDRTIRTLGMRYRPIPNVSIKVDFVDAGNAAQTGVDQVNFSLGYLF
jgi:hypothetical protein